MPALDALPPSDEGGGADSWLQAGETTATVQNASTMARAMILNLKDTGRPINEDE
jgi:hypothetical protein